MAEGPERIWVDFEGADLPEGGRLAWVSADHIGEPQTPYTCTDLFTRALSAAKEAAAELEGLHKAGVVPKGSKDILDMVKAEIEELEGE